jgi:uncharacterized repeat protein (TIGR03803 family)
MIQQSSLSLGSAASFFVFARRIRNRIRKPRKRRGDNMIKFNLWLRASGALLLWAAAAVALPAQTLTTLDAFCTAGKPTNCKDGAHPLAALIQGTDGNFYGTTPDYGGSDAGTIFKVTPSGTLTKVHRFDITDGDSPRAALVQGTDGNFYGTTYDGGIFGGFCDPGCGTVFGMTAGGTVKTLHEFNGADGAWPQAGLVQATNGTFYGTTSGGGTGNDGHGGGTVFKITPSGTLTTLYNFCSKGNYPNCTDGFYPVAGLVQGTDGNFYGTAQGGGANALGTVFKITPHGNLTTLYSFCSQSNCTDGSNPDAGLVQGTDGDFYGTTYNGGPNRDTLCNGSTCGTIFKITRNGILTTLYSFCPGGDNCTDGALPMAGLVQGTDGNFYGTTGNGGTTRHGTAFKLTPRGVLTTLHNFCEQGYPCADGSFPNGLIQATNGKLYGTTPAGATRSHACHNGCGTVFSLSVGLGPFVVTEPTSGAVGAAVKILGTDLTDATSVTFNGTAATFTVKSTSEITTTVPPGATTGKVSVTFPHGTRSSNVPFRVK